MSRKPEIGEVEYDDRCPWCGSMMDELHESARSGETECSNCDARIGVEAFESYALHLLAPGKPDKGRDIETFEDL